MAQSLSRVILAPARQPRDVDVAFFTLGDTRDIVPGKGVILHTDAWQRRALTLATSRHHVHGVPTVAEAIATLEAMPAQERIGRIFFIGHGFAGGFFFSGTPVGRDDFEAPHENVLEDPSPTFALIAAPHVRDLDNASISDKLVQAFAAQAIALDQPGAAISVLTPGKVWRVRGVVGGPSDLQDFIVERTRKLDTRTSTVVPGHALEVFTSPAFEGRTRTRRFIDVLISRLSEAGHVEVNFLSCFTAEPDDVQHRLDILVGSEMQRHGFKDFSVGAYKNYYQVEIRRAGGRDTFFDHVTDPPGHAGRVFVRNPGPNRIPPFERIIFGPSISAP